MEEALAVAADDVAEVDTTRAELAARLILDQALALRRVQDAIDAGEPVDGEIVEKKLRLPSDRNRIGGAQKRTHDEK